MIDDAPTAEAVSPLLTTRALGRRLVYLPRCGSTNDEAVRAARAGAPHGTVVVAETQEAGRGRLGRSWFSPAGKSLYVSFVLRPALPPHAAPPLSLAAGVAVAETAAAHGVRAALKWPNDVIGAASGRKLAGVLTEMVSAGGAIELVVVGIGLNVHATAFPPDLADRAGTLETEPGRAPGALSRPAILATLCARLEEWCDRLEREGPAPLAAAWRSHGDPAGRRMRVLVGAREVEGVARGVDDEGALLLDADDGKHYRVLSGEIVA